MLEQGSSNRNLMSVINPAGSGIVSGQSSVLMHLTPQEEQEQNNSAIRSNLALSFSEKPGDGDQLVQQEESKDSAGPAQAQQSVGWFQSLTLSVSQLFSGTPQPEETPKEPEEENRPRS